ncbi:MAG: sialate O-acetylesterase [Bacteroidota bacterium]
MNRKSYSLSSLFIIMLSLLVFSAFADIKLPQLVSNHMVLQRDIKLKIWGLANIGEKVNISFNGTKAHTITGPDGKWLITLPAMKTGGPYTMSIKGNNEIILSDILIGDVWFCSGQSNMVLSMERLKEQYPTEVAQDNFPAIRNFFVPTKADVTKTYDDLPPGKWTLAVGQGVLEFGGVTYFFAKQLYQKYHIPIGIINSSVGGVPVEAWMSADAFKDFPDDLAQIKNFRDTAYMNSLSRQVQAASRVAMPRPLIEPDKGISGPVKWTDATYVPQNWHRFWMPGYWADQGVKGLNGILYFRKEIDVPASMTGMPAKLFVGRIIDADSTFVNGKFVGNTTYQYPPRRYNVPAGVLKPGKNIIVVKVINTAGKGGFVPDKNYSLNTNGQRIDLRGEWTYQVGQVQPKITFDAAAMRGNSGPRPIIAQNAPTGLYNTMAAPAINYAIKGFIWYQGEANTTKAREYAKLLPALITDWRSKWGEGNIPFLFPQLPNFMEVDYSPGESDWAQLRQSQLEALSIPNTGMAVAIDAGEWNDIHPLDKKDVGERLALWAEHLAYGANDPVYSGPIYQSSIIEGNKVILKFTNTGGGLTIKGGGDLYYFAIAGADKKYVWAKAKIDGDKVIVWSDAVTNPVTVRYAWADNPEGANLYNKEGLPASPFETGSK